METDGGPYLDNLLQTERLHLATVGLRAGPFWVQHGGEGGWEQFEGEGKLGSEAEEEEGAAEGGDKRRRLKEAGWMGELGGVAADRTFSERTTARVRVVQTRWCDGERRRGW
jgi:hypothetical protein